MIWEVSLPLVSGMTNQMKKQPSAEIAPYVKKTPPMPAFGFALSLNGPFAQACLRSLTVKVMTHERSQFMAVAREDARPFTFGSKISAMMDHGMAPIPLIDSVTESTHVSKNWNVDGAHGEDSAGD